jgi:hypothetical protein
VETRVRAELLPNGLVRVWDYGCAYSATYDHKAEWQNGPAPDCVEYRMAVRALLVAEGMA